MARISFIDNSSEMAKAFVDKDYKHIDSMINSIQDKISYYIKENDFFVGYDISKNKSLSEIYSGEFYVVKFLLSNIDTIHKEKQSESLKKLFANLKEEVVHKKGYYNLRIPSHIVDMLKAYNKIIDNGIFCGGTVEQISHGKSIDLSFHENINNFFADINYVKKNRDNLLNIAFSSFDSYQGQYHISDITSYNAGEIYKNWLKQSLDICENNVVVAEWKGNPVGFATILETDNSVKAVLTAVAERYRNKGIYKSMIVYLINYANGKGKSFTISTQYDNYIVQGVWASMGLKPYYSIYNFHVFE